MENKEDKEFELIVAEKRHKEIVQILKELVDVSSKEENTNDLSILNQSYNKLINVLSRGNNNDVLINSMTNKIEELITKLETKKEFLFTIERDEETENIISINAKQL